MSETGRLLLAFGLLGCPAAASLAQNAPEAREVQVPMRDGVKLGADLYLPPGPGPVPVLLAITPYGKGPTARYGPPGAANGYAVVVVDSRGLRASGGTWEPYIH